MDTNPTNLPPKALRQWEHVYESAQERGLDKQGSAAQAWCAVKRGYKKSGSRWVLRKGRIAPDEQPPGCTKKRNPLTRTSYDGFCSEVADAYDLAPEYDQNEVWRWKLLGEHIRKLYKRMLSKVDVIFVTDQPYDNAEQMRKDIKRGILKISTDYNEHAVFDPETNLQFRAVHDYIIHGGDQSPDFSRRGEIRAYNKHRQLAPPDSWPALFTEVVGQACYFNTRGVFPVQKIAILEGFDFYNVGDQDESKKRVVATGRRMAKVSNPSNY